MAKKRKTPYGFGPQGTKSFLMKKLKKPSEEVAKTLSKAMIQNRNAGDLTKAVKGTQPLIDEIMRNVRFGESPLIKYRIRNKADHAWEYYLRIKGVKEESVRAGAKSEFFFYYFSNHLDKYRVDNVPPYIAGDVVSKPDPNTHEFYQGQVKKAGGYFKIDYSRKKMLEIFEKRLAENPNSDKIAVAMAGMALIEDFDVNEINIDRLESTEEKVKYMKIHLALSVEQYFFFTDRYEQLYLSVPAEDMVDFVRDYSHLFTFTDVAYKEKLKVYQLQFDKNNKMFPRIWYDIVSGSKKFFPIHSFDDLFFYSRRGLIRGDRVTHRYRAKDISDTVAASNYTVQNIEDYNENIIHSHFDVTHDLFFGGLKYPIKRRRK